jgi:hypothetical protein
VIALLLVFGISSAICLGALGFGYLAYDRATQPDRTTPGVAVRQFVEASLNERDAGRAKLFTCDGSDSPTEIRQLLADIQGKEKSFGVRINVASEQIDATVNDNKATVTAKLRLSVSSGGDFQEQIQEWRFDLARRSGWRVCDAHRIG